MWLQDGGLGKHGVWVMRDDGARMYRDAAVRRRALRARGSGDDNER